jgi:chorismate--pyruvate lyase
MRAKRIGKWLSGSALKMHLADESILDWLHEEGSITSRISSNTSFKLEILNDGLGMAEQEEYIAIDIPSQEVRIREVILYGDNKPIVYAKSIIPPLTSSEGYPGLGTIGSKPLGDLIFQSKLFISTNKSFAKFETSNGEIVWGRKINYLIKGHPFSIMEVFLLP